MYGFGDNEDLKIDVFINNSSGGEVASKLTGYFVVKNKLSDFLLLHLGELEVIISA
ncbi:MAG: hypothetical protein MUO21_04135 [Nitrososphaeraceae archaeon]|nr:hypothetical protein [Nitrososphaeraceae archaeon]